MSDGSGGSGDSPEDVSADDRKDGPGPSPADEVAVRVAYADVDGDAAVRGNRRWWDQEAAEYQAEHGELLGGLRHGLAGADLVWCPEGLREQDARLLGPAQHLVGARVLEVGSGAAQCGAWLAGQGARVLSLDLSGEQLRHALPIRAALPPAAGARLSLVQADALHLPLPDACVDLACSAFGAVPFVIDSAALMQEVARVLRPGGTWTFSVTHPMRWCFRDDPGPEGLVVERSYFDRSPYTELDDAGEPLYVEQHRTLGDRVREIVGAGLELLDVVEPEWPEGHDREWGQWSPLRGRLFPGTAIYRTRLPAGPHRR